MIKKLIENLNYKFKESFIVLFFIFFITFIVIKQSEFKSIDEFKGKQIHLGGNYIGKILSSSAINFDSNKNKEFKKLNKFLKKNKLTRNGFPFTIYTSRSQQTIQYIAAIPIKDCKKINLPIKLVCNYFPKQDVLTVIHKGYLNDRNKGWEILEKELLIKDKELFNAPFEVYLNGIEQTKDSTTWITGLYYPIK